MLLVSGISAQLGGCIAEKLVVTGIAVLTVLIALNVAAVLRIGIAVLTAAAVLTVLRIAVAALRVLIVVHLRSTPFGISMPEGARLIRHRSRLVFVTVFV